MGTTTIDRCCLCVVLFFFSRCYRQQIALLIICCCCSCVCRVVPIPSNFNGLTYNNDIHCWWSTYSDVFNMETHSQSGNNSIIEIGEQWTEDVVGNRITPVHRIQSPSPMHKINIIEDENVIIR